MSFGIAAPKNIGVQIVCSNDAINRRYALPEDNSEETKIKPTELQTPIEEDVSLSISQNKLKTIMVPCLVL